jgi:phospholipid/cholesterol/gamma-HCH transport system substrate-binding protein
LKFSREIRTAILIIGCLGTFVFGFNYLKGTSLFDNQIELYAIYNDVEGLIPGAKVTINGYSVGKVTEINFDKTYDEIKVSFTVREDLTFSSQSIAQIYEPGLIGGKAIALLPKYDGDPIKNGVILPSDIKPGLTELVNQQIAPLQDKIEGLLSSADSLFAGVSNILNYESQNNLKLALKGMTESVENINSLSRSMSILINSNERSLSSTFGNIEITSRNLVKLTDSLSKLELGTTFKNMESASNNLRNILSTLERGDGTAGKLINDDQLYTELLKSSEALESLLTDLKEHPKKYVHFSIFGKKDKTTPKK